MGACSSVPFIGIYASSYVMVALLATLSGVALVVEGTRLRSPAINRLLVAWLKPLLKETEGRRITGATYIALSALAAFLLFDKTVAIAALFFLAVGDPAAALVGSRVRGVRFFGKSPLGTLAFVAAAMAMAGILSAGGVVAFQWTLAVGAVVAALVEIVPSPVDDNVSIPLVSGAAMAWMGV